LFIVAEMLLCGAALGQERPRIKGEKEKDAMSGHRPLRNATPLSRNSESPFSSLFLVFLVNKMKLPIGSDYGEQNEIAVRQYMLDE